METFRNCGENFQQAWVDFIKFAETKFSEKLRKKFFRNILGNIWNVFFFFWGGEGWGACCILHELFD